MSCHRDPRMMSHYASELRRAEKVREKAATVAKREPSALTAAALNEALAAEALLWEEALRAGLDLNALDKEVSGALG